MSQIYAEPQPSAEKDKQKERCLRGKLHLTTGMKILVLLGLFVLAALVTLLFFKFRKATFVLLLPASVSVVTVFSLLTRRPALVWPLIAISCFHVILSAYALLIFSFYFIFKPFYIIMVLNWAFDTLHNDKTASYYAQCGVLFAVLVLFLLFNLWQGAVAYSFHRLLLRRSRKSSAPRGSSATIVVVNKQPSIDFASSHY